MIDFHSHILPGVDHGSDSLETSLSQLELANKYSIKTIVCTSHFYPHRNNFERFIARRDKGFELLSANNTFDIRLIKGSEVMLTLDLSEFKKLEKLCIEGTNLLLIEMPDMLSGTWIYDALSKVRDKGITPVIAHIDRYPEKVVENLLDMDFIIQVNASAFSNIFKKFCMKKFVKSGLIHVLGSDIHGANETAYKKFVKAKSKLGKHFNIMQKNAKDILGI